MFRFFKNKKARKAQISLSVLVLLLNTHVVHSTELVIDYSQTSLSGLSSGGYMATQFHLAHADSLKGVGIIAAGSYYCAKGSITTALSECVNKTPENFRPIESYYIGPNTPNNLATADDIRKTKVWLLHGTQDTRIARPVSDGLYQQYKSWIDEENLIYIDNKAFAHLFPTLRSGSDCTDSVPPFIGACNYDAAGALLTHIYNKLRQPVPNSHIKDYGKLIRFSQAKLVNIEDTGLNESGFVFVPKTCNSGEACKLHVSFHGCNQSIDNVGDKYATMTGLNEWAASNNMIVLYPQIKKSAMFPMNPQACWDWWGYTDENYANKDGKQINAVHRMMLNLPKLSLTRSKHTQ